MELERLRVLHTLKTGKSFVPGTPPVADAFFLDSCQRMLWVCTDEQLSSADLSGDFYEKLEILSGVAGYAFLIRVAAGLESQVVGETDIFGQMKEALRFARVRGVDSDVEFWIQKCFEDTKEVRSRYLENLGGGSYGALVRKFFSDKNVGSGPTLLVGAGQLAHSVAPYLADSGELWILNRSLEKATALVAELIVKGARADRIRIVTDEAEAFARASRVVICIPMLDRQVGAWTAGFAQDSDRVLLHLGVLREASGEWKSAPNSYFLDDIFALQKIQNQLREHQVQNAARACEERAKLRGLAASVSIHHGWEDLAIFA